MNDSILLLPDNAVPVYENHQQLGNGRCPPYIYHTPNPVPEIISPHNFECHWHEGVELLGFVEGSADVTCDSARYRAEAGQLVIINSNRLHMIESAAPGCRYHCLILERDYCTAHGVAIESLEFAPVFTDETIMAALDHIFAETEHPTPYDTLRIEAEVLCILAELCTQHRICTDEPDGANRTIDLAKRTIQFLNEHYRDSLSLDEICGAVGFSKYYLCRTFRAVTGQTVIDYINARRCRSAQSMLTHGECNVSECAEACGFSSISYFTRQYRRIVGEPPSATRRANRGYTAHSADSV